MLSSLMTSNDIEVFYRNYDFDAFSQFINENDQSVRLVTYTSPLQLLTVFSLIQKRFPKLTNLKLIIGFKRPEYLDDIEKFKGVLASIQSRLSNNYWSKVELNLTLHSHCHVKFLRTDTVCLAGSQNFTGMSLARNSNKSAYHNNELLLQLKSAPNKLDSLTNALFSSLLEHDDDYVQFDKDTFLIANPNNIFNEIQQNFIDSINRKSRNKAKIIDKAFIFDQDVEVELLGIDSTIDDPFSDYPKIFLLSHRIEYITHLHQSESNYLLIDFIADLRLIIAELEAFTRDSVISDKLELLEDRASELNLVSFKFHNSLHRIDQGILSEVERQLYSRTVYTSNWIVKKQLFSLLSSIVEQINQRLKFLNLYDFNDFVSAHTEDIVRVICDDPSSYIEFDMDMSGDEVESWARDFVSESLEPSEVFKYIGKVEDELVDDLSYFSEVLADCLRFDGLDVYRLESELDAN